MRYKILLAGKNRTIVDDFFHAMDQEFECLTTSNRSGDITNHIKYFQPDAFVYCFASETRDDILKLVNALEDAGRKCQQVILIGDPGPCSEFMRLRPEWVRLLLQRPITTNTIREKLLKYFEKSSIAAEKVPRAENAEELENLYNLVKTIQFDLENMPEVPELLEEPKHILVIDDDPIMLRLIKAELKDTYNVATAISGKIGLKFLERKKTDLIILDYEMPEEDGPAVLEKLRANEETKDIPVIFLTGINDREKIRKVVTMKPQGYLLKPIECEKLIATIREIIG